MAGAVKRRERSRSTIDKNYECWRRSTPIVGAKLSQRRIRQAVARIFGK
jgi:hypothetical protein